MAHLLIVELPGGNDADIVHAALERGDSFSFLTHQIAHYQRQRELFAMLSQAHEIVELPYFDYPQLEEKVLAVHARRRIDAVLCLVDTRLIDAARLAARLGLRHIAPNTATLLRDKYRVRCHLAQRGLAQPPFELAESNEGLKRAVSALGLPVLIKPADGYGSQNIVVLRQEVDLDPLLTPLEDMLPSRLDYGLGVSANDRLLVERFMEGTVVGCDTLSVDGTHRMLGINEKSFFDPPSFAIRGGCFTPHGTQFAAIERYVFSVLDALGFDWGATHTELMLTPEGPRLIEVNARLVGARIPRLVSYALQRNFHADLIDVHLGKWPQQAFEADSACVGVTRWIVADTPGILQQVELPDWQDDGIRCVEILKQPGDRVRAPFENADRIGCVMVTAETRTQAEEIADRFVAQTRVRLRHPQLCEPQLETL